ncbi:MAG TPA: GNAT family protein [Thermomicrobiales bacterium]|nr:GNAT family protein [Thermomicrobiales bacterium]
MRNPVLVGERVYLRPLEPDDADTISEFEAQENETITHMGGRTPMSPIALRKMISEEFKTMPPGTVEFAVCLKENDEMIGGVGVTGIDWVHGHGETFSHLRPGEWRGQGYGTEAKHLLLEYCFDHIGLHVLTSWVWELNGRSAAALAKQGYRSAGRLKADGIEKGVYYDDMVFDLLRADWTEARDVWQASQRARSNG